MRCAVLAILSTVLTVAPLARAQAQEPDVAELVEKAVAYLEAAQAEDGAFTAEAGPGVTGLVVTALLANGQEADSPVVAKGLKFLEQSLHPDGGVYSEGSTHKNYETCVAMMAFDAANTNGRYDEILQRAKAFIKLEQWDEGENLAATDVAFGGAGYGGSSRPDLSNTSFLIETLIMVGDSPEDPAIQRALAFVSRCQNLETEHNPTTYAPLNPDGGFYYTIAAGGSSPAGNTENGGLRSYGSMTYQGLKSMIYAGVGPDDERVKAALEWIAKNYTLAENPGMGGAGLYYYYHTFAKALSVVGKPELVDASGAAHDWKQELVAALAAAQRDDGSWVNENERWLESDPNLVTAYALLALSYCD
jgi:squalene-hopene/tetraprenyl-beta-curcumene cyclase